MFVGITKIKATLEGVVNPKNGFPIDLKIGKRYTIKYDDDISEWVFNGWQNGYLAKMFIWDKILKQ
jgi:hypothetical protein